MPSFDAIVIGGGSNGLAAAGRLAKAGRKTVLLERDAITGGGAVTREFVPGYRINTVAHVLNMLDRRVETELQLARHGLTFAATGVSSTALSPAGDHLVLEGAYGETLKGSIDAAQQAAWQDLRGRLLRYAAVLRPFREMPPPRLGGLAGNDLLGLARRGLDLRRLGRDGMREFFRLLLINAADVLEDELQDSRLKGLVAFDAVLGAHLGPRSPNSLMLLFNRLSGEVSGQAAAIAVPAGGMAAVAAAMTAAVRAAGVELRANAGVKRIILDNGRATGVALADGEILTAPLVLSAVNPVTTMMSLVGAPALETGLVRRVRNIRSRGNAAKLHLALRAAPDFRGADLRSRLVIAPSVRAVEEAFNPAKYGELPDEPVMEMMIQSAFEPGHAPVGHHVLSAIVQHVPHAPKGGWDAMRQELQTRIMRQLEAYAPGIGDLVVGSELLTPQDLESQFGFVGGNWHHGELAVEQMLFLRPAIGLAHYETPVSGLFLAGAGSHPGGGISGAAGWNAAGAAIAAGGRK